MDLINVVFPEALEPIKILTFLYLKDSFPDKYSSLTKLFFTFLGYVKSTSKLLKE